MIYSLVALLISPIKACSSDMETVVTPITEEQEGCPVVISPDDEKKPTSKKK